MKKMRWSSRFVPNAGSTASTHTSSYQAHIHFIMAFYRFLFNTWKMSHFHMCVVPSAWCTRYGAVRVACVKENSFCWWWLCEFVVRGWYASHNILTLYAYIYMTNWWTQSPCLICNWIFVLFALLQLGTPQCNMDKIFRYLIHTLSHKPIIITCSTMIIRIILLRRKWNAIEKMVSLFIYVYMIFDNK